MQPNQIYLSQLLFANILRQDEVDYLLGLDVKYSWAMPGLSIDLLTVDRALQLCRYEHTMRRIGVGALLGDDLTPLVNLMMKLLQGKEIWPCMVDNVGDCVEHIISTGTQMYFLVVPHNMSAAEIGEMNEADVTIRYKDLRYADTTL